MPARKRVTKKEAQLLKQLRGYDKDECIEIWNDRRRGVRHKVPRGFWEQYNHRKYVVEAFVKEYQEKNPGEYPDEREFNKNKLSGLLSNHYSNSPWQAFAEGGFTDKSSKNYDLKLDETPWLVLNIPKGYWENSTNVKKAVDWLAEKISKEITQLKDDDFIKNDLHGLHKAYAGSPILIIRKAGYEIKELERDKVSQRYWADENNRIQATTELASIIQKSGETMRKKDFDNNRLGGIAVYFHRKGKTYRKALQEAGLLEEKVQGA